MSQTPVRTVRLCAGRADQAFTAAAGTVRTPPPGGSPSVPVQAVEDMRHWMLEQGRERDAILVELLAYAGLRPESEAVTLPWRGVRDASILVQATKTSRERTLPMLAPLRESLHVWRLRCARPPAGALVVPPRTGDAPWTRDEWRYWRRHRFAPAARAVGLPDEVRPRDLRGSLASLLIHEGRSIVEVGVWMGHSPEVCLRDYAQILSDVEPGHRMPAEQAIREARARAERPETNERNADAA